MSSALLRSFLTAAVAAVVAIAPASSAEAGPAASPFAGTYRWITGSPTGITWAVAISDKGQITGSLLVGSGYTKGSLGGRVGGDGSYSFTMSLTAPTIDNPERPRNGGPKEFTERTSFSGMLAPDADGNLVGTPDAGGSFTWLIQ